MRNPNRLNQLERKKVNRILKAIDSIRQPVESDEALDYVDNSAVAVQALLVLGVETPLTDEIEEALEALEEAHSAFFDIQAEADHAVKVFSDACVALNIMLLRRQK